MNVRRIALFGITLLLPALATAQGDDNLAGKWMVDRERMLQLDPSWDGELTQNMWIATSGVRGDFFEVARGIDEDTTRGSDNVDRYDPYANPTTVSLDEGKALATARWEGDRLVVRLYLPDDDRTFTRIIYREERWLVVEEHGRPSTRWAVTYFEKT